LKINFGRAFGGKLIKISYFTEGYKRADWKQQGSADRIGKGGSYLHSIRKFADFRLKEESAGAVSVYDQRGLADLGSPEVKSADMDRDVKGTVLSRIGEGRSLPIRACF
jgi:hypothetical protein